ncbi:MAG: hypothetical protein ACYCV7_04775 [Acidimicrobiales bacterium]
MGLRVRSVVEVVDNSREGGSVGEHVLDLFVYAPAGLILSALDEFPKLAALGRIRLNAQVSTARVIGEFAVKTGQQQLKRKAGELFHRRDDADDAAGHSAASQSAPPDRKAGEPGGSPVESRGDEPVRPAEPLVVDRSATNGHVPAASSLAIPGFDTLSASQVVQRLGGLSRGELVAARAYEAGNRGRRTVLGRIDQLLEQSA